MNSLITFLHRFVIVVITGFLFIGGLGGCYFSASLALAIVQDLVPQNSNVNPIYLLATFELSKVALIFITALLVTSSSEKHFRSWVLITRNFLVAISISCSLGSLIYSMSNPMKDEMIAERNTELLSQLKTDKSALNNLYDAQIERESKTIQERINNQEALIEIEKGRPFKGTDIVEGQRYKKATAEKLRLEGFLVSRLDSINVKRLVALEKVQLRYENKRDDYNDQTNDVLLSGSKAILACLRLFSADGEVNRTHYLLAMIVISLLFTAGIELIILISFQTMCFLHGGHLRKNIDAVHQNLASKVKYASIENSYKAEAEYFKAKQTSFYTKSIDRLKSAIERSKQIINNLFSNHKNA